MRGVWLLLLVSSFASCTYPRIDLEGRRCPCVAGWRCGPDGLCVPDDDTSVSDVPGLDAPALDAPRTDTNELDVPSIDAFGADVSAEDAAADTGLDAPPPIDAGPCHDQTLELTLAIDDGSYEPDNIWNPDGTGFRLHCGRTESGTLSEWCYFRFLLRDDVPVAPRDLRVFLELAAAGTSAGWSSSMDRFHLTVQFEVVGDAVAVTALSLSDVMARVMTLSPSVRWPATGGLPWAAGGYQRSPDVAAAFRSVLTEHGPLLRDRHVQVWVQAGDGTSGFMESVLTPAAAGAGGTPNPARLLIHWCDPI